MTADATTDITTGPFVLSGPVTREEACQLPIRGDLAHIGLAGRYFVPHYIVPQHFKVGADGASLQASTSAGSEMTATLSAGEDFEVLDIAEGWAWGCSSIEGPSGYVRLDAIERVDQ